jgi:hypothetical protein
MPNMQRSVVLTAFALAVSAQALAGYPHAPAIEIKKPPAAHQPLSQMQCEFSGRYGAEPQEPAPTGSSGPGGEAADCD